MIPRTALLIAALLCLVGTLAFFFLRGPSAPGMPLSEPPPGGGSLKAPSNLGGAPVGAYGTDPTWTSRVLPQYGPDEVLWEYYDARAMDRGLISVVAIKGPVEDLPDRKSVGHFEDWTLHGLVQCSPLWIGTVDDSQGDTDLPDEPVKSDGHVCWQSSGDFSASVLTSHHDLDETVSLTTEFWSTQ